MTVQSAKTLASSHLKRFPSDLLESSVDPVLPNTDFQELTQSSTLLSQDQVIGEDQPDMVRVYRQPAVSHRGQTTPTGLQPQPLNGFQVRTKNLRNRHVLKQIEILTETFWRVFFRNTSL